MEESIIDLRNQGYSIRDIARTLNISRSRVHRIIQSDSVGAVSEGETDENQADPWSDITTAQQQIDIHQTELISQQRRINKQSQQIAAKAEDLALWERKLAQKQQLLDAEKVILELDQITWSNQRDAEPFPAHTSQYVPATATSDDLIAQRKQVLAERYNRLINEVIENCDDCSWSAGEVEDWVERGYALCEQINAFTKENGIVTEGLRLREGMNYAMAFMNEVLDATEGLFWRRSVDLDFAEDERQRWKNFPVESFADRVSAESAGISPGATVDRDETRDSVVG